MNIKKSFILLSIVMVLSGLVSCGGKPEDVEQDDKKPEFSAGWYVFEGMTTRYFLYYSEADEIMFGGIFDQQFDDSTLSKVTKNYKYDDAWKNLYYMNGEKITNKLNDKNEKIDDFELNMPEWMNRVVRYCYTDPEVGFVKAAYKLYDFADLKVYEYADKWWYKDSE